MINYTVYYYIESTVHHNIKHYGIIQENSTLHSNYCITQVSLLHHYQFAVQCCTEQSTTILYSLPMYCTVHQCTVLLSVMQYCKINIVHCGSVLVTTFLDPPPKKKEVCKII